MATATPNSSATSYAAPSDLTARVDARTVEQLASDTNVPLTSGAVATDTNVLAALADASGMVESACLAGGRYTAADLNALTGQSASFLKMLVCDLALGRLVLRRPQKDKLPAVYTEAMGWLDRLRWGERIFAFAETEDAGHYQNNPMTEADLETLNLSTFQAQRLFGIRAGRNRQS